MTVQATHRSPFQWVGWVAAAMAASLWHAFIDQHVGLHGPVSDQMSLHQASAVLLGAVVVAWWALMVAEAVGRRLEAVRAVLVVVVYQAVLMDGLVAFVAAPPPSAAFPYQDLAHAAALGLGLVATYSVTSSVGTGRWGRRGWTTLALLVAHSVVSGTLMVSNL